MYIANYFHFSCAYFCSIDVPEIKEHSWNNPKNDLCESTIIGRKCLQMNEHPIQFIGLRKRIRIKRIDRIWI